MSSWIINSNGTFSDIKSGIKQNQSNLLKQSLLGKKTAGI